MCAVVVNVGGVWTCCKQTWGVGVFGAVVEAVWRWPAGFELVPGGVDAVLLLEGVVENRVGVVKAPVGDANQDIFTGITLWQTNTCMYGVGVEVFDGFVEVRANATCDFEVVDTIELRQGS